MEIFTKKSTIQKIIIAVLIILLFNFAMPMTVNAEFTGGKLLMPVVDLFRGLGDVIMGALQKYMMGTENYYNSYILSEHETENIKKLQQYAKDNPSEVTYTLQSADADQGLFGVFHLGERADLEIPNVLYSPETIFANKVAALDVNFIKPNKYIAVQERDEAREKATSSASKLQGVISSWYSALRNIAIVGLLSILVYIGIRILISSTAADKAKYKERIMDWLVALCLLFLLHYIMSFTLVMTEEVTKMFSAKISQGVDIEVSASDDDEKIDKFKTTFLGYFRFMTQVDDDNVKVTFTILYLVLVVFTCMFTITYLKRFLYMAFFTMIAPLVALTYPIDKLTDGKAQAFNMWVKEYIFNALLQPMHLLLYTILIGSSLQLAMDNPIYAIVSMGFLLPAEKFIKKMFGFNKSETAATLGTVAGGALAMNAIKQISSIGKKMHGGDNAENADGLKGIKNPAVAQNKDLLGNFNTSGSIGNSTIPILGNGKGTSTQSSTGTGIPNPQTILPNGFTQTPSGIAVPSNTIAGNSSQVNLNATPNPTPLNLGSSNNDIKATRRKAIKGAVGSAMSRSGRALGRLEPSKLPKGLGKLARKAVVGGAGAAVLGGAGLVAGIASGDLGKAAEYTLGAGIIGANLANNMGDRAAEKVGKDASAFAEDYKQARYTKEKLEKDQQEKYNSQWKLNEQNARYLESKFGVKEAQKLMENGTVDEYLKRDVTDVKMMAKSMKMIGDSNEGYSSAVEAAKEAELVNTLDADTFSNTQKAEALKNRLSSSGLEADKMVKRMSKLRG